MDRLKQFTHLLTEIGFSGLVDIAIVTLVSYVFLVAVKRTRRSGLILTGLVIVGAIYLDGAAMLLITNGPATVPSLKRFARAALPVAERMNKWNHAHE